MEPATSLLPGRPTAMDDGIVQFLMRLQSCRRLINAGESPIRLSIGAHATSSARLFEELLLEACDELGIHRLTPVAGPVDRPSGFERIVWHRLKTEPWTIEDLAASAKQTTMRRDAIAIAKERDPLGGFRVNSVRSARGARLRTYEAGAADLPTWLLVLPYGVPVELSLGLAAELARGRRFLLFEGPDLSCDADEFDRLRHGIDETVSDILSVLDEQNVSRVHLASVCAGVMPAVRFASQYPERVASIALGNGAYWTQSAPPSDFVRLVRRVGGNRDKARMLYQFMAAQDLAKIEPESPHLTMLPYAHPENLHRFTTAFQGFYEATIVDDDLNDWLRSIDRPALVVVGDRDTLVPPEGSHRVAARLRNGRIFIEKDGTHLSVLRVPSAAMVAEMLALADQAERALS